jgi:hypothetical protein
MMVVAVETGAEFSFSASKQLFSGDYVQTPAPARRGYDVARDGRFLMIQPQSGGNDASVPASIVVVQNFTEELKRRVRASDK